MSLILYGYPASQPSRAVYWACLLNDQGFELCVPQLPYMRGPEFRALNPKAQVPVIVDEGFSLYEMPAILAYLCGKYGWEDFYPHDLETRARIDQYLHFHHSSTRLATFKLMAPHVTVAFDAVVDDGQDIILTESIRSAMAGRNVLERGRSTVRSVATMIEAGYLADSEFLCGTPHPTIADIACYEELAQLCWAGLTDFEDFPRLDRWLDAMSQLPYHEPAHRYNAVLGDILEVPNTVDRFVEANVAGITALAELGVPVVGVD